MIAFKRRGNFQHCCWWSNAVAC